MIGEGVAGRIMKRRHLTKGKGKGEKRVSRERLRTRKAPGCDTASIGGKERKAQYHKVNERGISRTRILSRIKGVHTGFPYES